MPFDGNGIFSPVTPEYPAIAGTVIEAVKWNAVVGDIATGLSNTVTRDGQSSMLASLNMAGNKLTGLGQGGNVGDSVSFEQVLSAPGALLPSLTTLTQAFGDSSSKIATTAFVNAVAFSSALPSQIGNAGKFVTTDGANASWASALTPAQLAAADGAALCGYTRPEAGAILRDLEIKTRERISVPDFGTLAVALTARSAVGTRMVVPSGTAIAIAVNTTIPATWTLDVEEGALITIAVGVTLTVLGEIASTNYEIFDGLGTVNLDNGASGYNLAWFKTTNGYINERWDFAKRGMTSFRTKLVRVPKPREGQAGVFTDGGRNFWYFSNPILFTDSQNACVTYVEAEFYAQQNCDAFLQFSDAAKPENIYFYGPIQAFTPAATTVSVGIDVRAGSRMSFFGQVVLNGFKTSVSLGGANQNGGVEDIYMPRTEFYAFSVAAVAIYGKTANTVQNIRIGNLRATAAQSAGLPVVTLGGLIRDVKIDNIYYATDVAKSGFNAFDAGDVVLINSDAQGTVQHCEFGGIYSANADNAIRIKSDAGLTNTIDITFRRIFGKFHGSGAVVDRCQYIRLLEIENSCDVTVGANASNVQITDCGGLRTLTNAGTATTVNNLGYQTRGGGSPPSPLVPWAIGNLIQETSDGRLYIRVALAGLASDFVQVGGPPLATYTIANVTTLRTYDVATVTLAQVANTLGTLVADLRARGVVL